MPTLQGIGCFDFAVQKWIMGAATGLMKPENFQFLLKLYFRPLGAMSEIIDRGSWLFGAVAVAAVSVLFQFAVTAGLYQTYQAAPIKITRGAPVRRPAAPAPPVAEEGSDEPDPRRQPLPIVGTSAWWFLSFSPLSVLTSVVSLALLYVPFSLLVMVVLEQLGSFGVVLRRDYGSLLACTLMGWAAGHLPFALAGMAASLAKPAPQALLGLWVLGKILFAVFMVCALRTVFGASYTHSIVTVSFSWISVVFESYLTWLASPFLLYFGYSCFQGDIGDILSGFRDRQTYRRFLESATINPRDAEAHYQLGLIHQHRHQLTEAAARFRRAVEIDPGEVDAHYQLGRIARAQGRLDEALDHFQSVVKLDNQHAQGDIWREIGVTLAAASRTEEARAALERFDERRNYDPEGLYYFGETLSKLGEKEKAREIFDRCVEAEKTNPYHRHGRMRQWRRLAEKQLKALKL